MGPENSLLLQYQAIFSDAGPTIGEVRPNFTMTETPVSIMISGYDLCNVTDYYNGENDTSITVSVCNVNVIVTSMTCTMFGSNLTVFYSPPEGYIGWCSIQIDSSRTNTSTTFENAFEIVEKLSIDSFFPSVVPVWVKLNFTIYHNYIRYGYDLIQVTINNCTDGVYARM